MLRFFSIIVVLFFACFHQAWADSTCALTASGNNQLTMPFPAALKRGVTLTNWWEDQQNYSLSADSIHALHNTGFDFVQLKLSSSWLEMADVDQQKQKLAQLRCDIISLLNEGLTLVVSLSPPQAFQAQMLQHQEDVVPHIEKLWKQMQPVLADLPSWRIYLNLYDEPMIESGLWWRMQGKIIEDIRPVFLNNPLIATPGPFDGWWDLTDRVPYRDKNVFYNFHFFEPIFLTNHGADTNIAPKPIIYPVDKTFGFDFTDADTQKYVTQDWNRAAIATVIRGITTWRDHYSANIVCLGFGVNRSHVDDKSRANWLRDTHRSLDEMNIPWALAEYRGSFGIYDSQGTYDKGMVESLDLLQVKQKP